MKIGIVTCIHANHVCTGAGCLNAFYQKTDTFSEYDSHTRLAAFMTCNGCKSKHSLDPQEDPGMQEKLERLVRENIEVMHIGICTWFKNEEQQWYQCPRMQQICQLIQNKGIRVVQGTHKR